MVVCSPIFGMLDQYLMRLKLYLLGVLKFAKFIFSIKILTKVMLNLALILLTLVFIVSKTTVTLAFLKN